jgi:hypothetical protein
LAHGKKKSGILSLCKQLSLCRTGFADNDLAHHAQRLPPPYEFLGLTLAALKLYLLSSEK